MKTKIIVIIAIVLVAAALNALYIPTIISNIRTPGSPQHTKPANLDSQPDETSVSSEPGVIELDWSAFHDVKVKMDLEDIVDVNFPDSLKQIQGKTVRLAGLGFFLRDSVTEKKIQRFMLLPPEAIIWCCVPTPKPHPEWTVLVDSAAAPWLAPDTSKPFQVAIKGTLQLNRPETIDYLYTISDAKVVSLRPSEILDTSGLNVCEETTDEPSTQILEGI